MNNTRKLATTLFADMPEWFYEEEIKIKAGTSIFDSEETEITAEDGLAL